MDQFSSKPIIIIVSGPSGSGKKTLIDHIMSNFPKIEKVPTYTTRTPRTGEVENVDYVYISQEQFDQFRKSGEIFEYTKTYGDYYYGSPKRYLDASDHKDIITELDYKGMFRVRSASSRNVISIFIAPPPLKELEKRIKKRSNESNLGDRLKVVSEQMQFAWSYDYVLFNLDKQRFLDEATQVIRSEMIKRKGFHQLLTDRHSYDHTL
jgi:guanylate kinase